MAARKVFNDPKEYFPYIGHTLNKDFIENGRLFSLKHARTIKEFFIGNTFDDYVLDEKTEDTKIYEGDSTLFSKITTKGFSKYKEAAKNPKNVFVICPRHRSLIDFIAAQPIHYFLIKKDTMVVAGDNLFVASFAKFFRDFGGFMFLRKNKVFKRTGGNKLELTVRQYLTSVLPTYLKDQMIDGKEAVRHDMILFPEFYTTAKGNVVSSGRTKTGELGEISSIFSRILYKLSKDSDTNVYFVPANFSFSKYPDGVFLGHNSLFSQIIKPVKYLFELNYVFNKYPHFSERNPDAKLDITVNYSEAIKLNDLSPKQIKSTKEPDAFVNYLREQIGQGETIYPSTLLCKALEGEKELSFRELDKRVSTLVDTYQEKGIDVSNVDQFTASELAEYAATALNTNPRLLFHRKHDSTELITLTRDSVISNNLRMQNWYSNMLAHLD